MLIRKLKAGIHRGDDPGLCVRVMGFHINYPLYFTKRRPISMLKKIMLLGLLLFTFHIFGIASAAVSTPQFAGDRLSSAVTAYAADNSSTDQNNSKSEDEDNNCCKDKHNE